MPHGLANAYGRHQALPIHKSSHAEEQIVAAPNQTVTGTLFVSQDGRQNCSAERCLMGTKARRKVAPLPPVETASDSVASGPRSLLNRKPPETTALPYLAGNASETVVDALIDEPSAWRRTEDGSFYYGDTERTYVSIGDPRVPAAVNAEEAWNLVIQVGGDEAAQTLLYVMARCLTNESPLEKVRIHVNDSLSFRGLKRHRKGDFRPEQKRAEARRFRLLSDIWVTARDTVEVKSGRGTRKKSINVTSRLIEVSVESEDENRSQKPGGPIRLPAIVSADGTDVPYVVRAGIGDWARPYIETPESVKTMLHKIVQYDVNTDAERFAMRFSLAMMFNRVPERLTIAEILQSARLRVPDRRVDKFRDNVEDAFELLARDGLIGSWRYDVVNEDLPKTRWVNKWLEWGVAFTPGRAAIANRA